MDFPKYLPPTHRPPSSDLPTPHSHNPAATFGIGVTLLDSFRRVQTKFTTSGSTTPVIAQVLGLLEQIGGAVASARSAGRGTSQIALVGVASVERDTPLGILFGV